MTVKNKSTVETTIGPAKTSRPDSLFIIGPTPVALAQACAHVRNGYVLADMPITMFESTGNISFTLELGNPDAATIDTAEAAYVEATAILEARRQQDIEAAALRIVEAKAAAEKQAAIAAKIAEQEEALKKLKAELPVV